VIELARELPVALPAPGRREEVRTAVLAAGARTACRRARRLWLAPAMVAAAAGVVGIVAVVRAPQPPPAMPAHHPGLVRPHADARYLASSVGTEATAVESPPAAPPPASPASPAPPAPAVSSTSFARSLPSAPAGLQHSAASVAPSRRATPVHAAQALPVEAPSPSVEPPPGEAPAPPAPPARAPDELAYDQAWEALRAGDFARAASGFSQVLTLVPEGALVEDASFWRAVALARGKRIGEARSAFRDFLDGHARSPRAGEASAMLGWLLVDARYYDEAARRFTAAAGDASPAVRRSAQAGLDALAKRSHAQITNE
jgi:hypothetical protein